MRLKKVPELRKMSRLSLPFCLGHQGCFLQARCSSMIFQQDRKPSPRSAEWGLQILPSLMRICEVEKQHKMGMDSAGEGHSGCWGTWHPQASAAVQQPAGCGRRPTQAPWGQAEGGRPARLNAQQDRGAWLSPSLLLGQPCGDRWHRSKCWPPSEHPQSCQAHSTKTSKEHSLFCT